MLHSFARRHASKVTSPDVLIIGGGPGGYVAAIRAAQLGLKTICVEKENLLGGTCLREGCIPSKFLLNVSHHFHTANHELRTMGLNLQGKVTHDMKMVQRRKDAVLTMNSKGIESLFKKYGTTLERGTANIIDKNTIEVKKPDGSTVVYNPKNLVIASGSKAFTIPDYPVDEDVIVTSRGALKFQKVPESMFVIGAGVIGLEMATCYNGLGSKVTVSNLTNSIGGDGLDPQAAKAIQMAMRKSKIDFILGPNKTTVKRNGDKAIVNIADKTFEVDKVLISIGRRPNLEGFGLEKLNLKMNKNGTIAVNDRYQTSLSNVFAIGDIVPGPQLAHKAEEEGILCVEGIAGKKIKPLNYDAIPGVIYTNPEVATVGLSDVDARKKGIKVRVGNFPYTANSRARCTGQTAGFVKWICDENGMVIGMTIVGPNAGEAILEGTIAIQNQMHIEQVAHTIHPHPTLSEAVMEAAKAVMDKPIHL
ncbi:dihydrolipoamide dehydrogenase family protein [Tritrichomonas foetus]|uniref:Dihydrolipoyl dehydrogenase n=1 Tax=Tritrichomonas foetus TaxID=1144522 RepID=A0A1J4JFU8_9EUKA|nr:dihydrolipoamide dehydrogenase family protein [Tritrichomonas foetus]|eukprot:OHS97529.1 dihydrolipoamide dehydrogenase family protein [Tritrichomonas foetus]